MVESYIRELRRITIAWIALLLFIYLILLWVVSHYKGVELYFLGIKDVFYFYFDILFKASLLLSLPFLFIMLFFWIRDALTPEEEKTSRIFVVYTVISLFLAIFIASLLSVHLIFEVGIYLSKLVTAELLITPTDILGYVVYFSIVLYLLFQVPFIVRMLVRIGIIPDSVINRYKPYFYVLIYFLTALLSPGDLLLADLIITLAMVIALEIAVRI